MLQVFTVENLVCVAIFTFICLLGPILFDKTVQTDDEIEENINTTCELLLLEISKNDELNNDHVVDLVVTNINIIVKKCKKGDIQQMMNEIHKMRLDCK